MRVHTQTYTPTHPPTHTHSEKKNSNGKATSSLGYDRVIRNESGPGSSQLQVVQDLTVLTPGPNSHHIGSNKAYNALTSVSAQEVIENSLRESPSQQESDYYEIPCLVSDKEEDN